MLAAVMIFLGLLVFLTRLPGAIRPALARRMARAVLASARGVRVVGALGLIFAVLLFEGLRQSQAPLPYAWVAYVLAVIMGVAGIVFVFGASGLRRVTLGWIERMSDGSLRLLCLLGVAIGLALVAVGWFAYR